MKLRILGCGTSSGVPRIGNDWGSCDPADPRNRRLRASALIETARTRILIDTGPDMREQLLAAGVGDVDAIIWTHDHGDHTHGIDDVRQLMQNRRAPVTGFARPLTRAALEARFGYVFAGTEFYRPTIRIADLPDRLTIGDLSISVVDQPHGAITSAGLRFGQGSRSIVYSTDFHDLSDEMASMFEGTDIWVLDALRREPHPSHAHLSAALAFIERVAPRRAVLTHMDNSMDYRTLCDTLPPVVEPGYDGMELTP
ncbi:MBL fold metallo-hydrolase [Sphingomonas baiyangensis]|uniref:MBL fold metallo-hydrolase n=1 Tax=Sphingomonas baiyangensis TaxID=2572576 RepID=A0A4V5PTK5_9SPHN|nr:MBL fold metallo-hydrolase [Sphingomonas baiyangensis]TKD50448.1 MBL fold metallo-hydrolase [Sphingomonas baiyangensis]